MDTTTNTFQETETPTSSASTPQPTTPPTTLTNTESGAHNRSNPLALSICTHNVRGFNQDLKKQVWEQYCLEHQIQIIGLTETRLSSSNKYLTSKPFKTAHYTYFWSCLENPKAGTAIMISNHLTPHIHKVTTHPGYAIAIDIFFKHDFKFRIISTYLPCDNPSARLDAQNEVIKWIRQATSLNLLPIVMGDFNASTDNIHSSAIKYKLLQFLSYNNMYNLATHTQKQDNTWQSSRYSSQIDYIWAYHPILTYLTSYETDDPHTCTQSDHKILISRWSFPYAYQGKIRHKTRTYKRVFDYKSMDNNRWENFTNQVSSNLSSHNTPLDINTPESLETTWQKIQLSINKAALQHIPNKKHTVRNFQHTFSSTATQLHLSLKKLGEIIKKTKHSLNQNLPIPDHLNSCISQLNQACQLQIPLLPYTHQQLPDWINKANNEWKNLYHARNIENTKQICQQITDSIQKRCSKLITKPTSMLNSILDRHKDPVRFDNIKTERDVITDPPLIKAHIQQHFDNWTATRVINQSLFDSKWQYEYSPKHSINPNWYTTALQDFSKEEILSTLNQLPNNKACGPSGISYEMLKHTGQNCIQAITSLFNRCLSSQSIPKQWKEGYIFPISKKPIFDGNLANTRPISLVEHIKKLYTKLLNNRLSSIFSTHNILSPFNYVALPGNSTSTPIHILNNIIEDASCNSKQLWLLSQDMSKAYDSVNLELLQKSLHRIKMPQQLITTIANLLSDRTNQVITNFGLTNHYSVKNGIDQGETITPLLWRIYYDPLITHISSHYLGYNLATSWQTSLTHPHRNHLRTSISVLAYMDDTLWITESREELEEIIETAASFYQMADIQVNPSKSIFITKHTASTTIQFRNHTLNSITMSQPFKFLGCWFTLNNKQTVQTRLIQEEALNLANIAGTKNITDKQIAYVINTVIIPTIEYRLHNIILPQSTCNKILAKYLTIAKHKSHLSRSTPNSTMLNHNLYNIRNIWDIQLQHHISNLLLRLNNTSTLGITTRIRLQQLQNNLWSATNILQHTQPIIDGPNRHTTNFKIIQLLNHMGITVQANSNILWPQTIENNCTPLERILSKHPKYSTFKQQLRHKQILYLEQLCSTDNTTLLTWQHISPRLLHLPTGRKPLWFSYLEDTILSHNEQRTILPTISPQGFNPFAYQTIHIPKSLKPWTLTLQNNEIIIGQVRKTFRKTNTISITHWQHNMNLSQANQYPLPPIQCSRCPGCHLNSSRVLNCCTLEVPAALSTQFLGRRSINKQLKFNANYIDLIYSSAIKQPITIPPPPTIHITDTLTSVLFQDNPASLDLLHIAHTNAGQYDFTFYTDGSVIDIGTNQCSMGIGWVQIHSDQIIHKFTAQLQNWPSSYKAELLAILSAISTVPRNSTINIFTDSQSVISKYNKLKSIPKQSSKYYKFNSWPIWHTLLNVTHAFNIKLNLHKIKAHADNSFNNQADLLARAHSGAHKLLFNHANIHNPSFFLQWENHPVEGSTRRFIKNICKAHIIAMWSSQKRASEWAHFSHFIDWNATWLYFNNNQKSSNNFTNPKLNHLKSFKIKNLLNNLPTYSHLHSILPNIFPSPNCFHCNLPVSSTHWLTCQNTSLLNQIIHSAISKVTQSADTDLPPHQLSDLIRAIYTHPSFNPTPTFLDPYSLYSTIRGLVPAPLIQSLQPFNIPYKQASQIVIKTLLEISDEVYEQIWKPYCSTLAQWKKTNNISLRHNSSQPLPVHHFPRAKPRRRTAPTYHCPCGFPDQLHTDNNTCPPLGQASRKISIWSTMWIKYSTPINHILTIQI